VSKEMTNLIQAQRSYQFNTRAITIADQMLGLINGIR
ncbi:MAG: flagellar basal body rod C-terminal domain-containing protein, partial [Solibacillus isronensis]